MRVVIIEDEIVAAQNVQNALLGYDSDMEILSTLRSVKESIDWLTKNISNVDVIISDIQLTDGLSFEIFDHLEVKKPIIFTTAFNEYALRAFEVNSIDYLLKPITTEDITKAFKKLGILNSTTKTVDYKKLAEQILFQKTNFKKRFLVKSLKSLVSIPVKDIAYFLADGNFVSLTTNESKTHAVSYSLEHLEGLLDPDHFFRVTRHLIVNITAIKKAHPYFKGRLKLEVFPPINEDIVVSNKKAASLKEWLNK